MNTDEELRALDREWATLAGWKNTWVDPDTGYSLAPPRYSSDPATCFGEGGPWRWMVDAELEPTLDTTYWDGRPLFACEAYRSGVPMGWHSAKGECEAVTRCAIEARKKLEAAE